MEIQKSNEIQCKHCSYEWITGSQLQSVSCPNCSLKTPNQPKKEVAKNDEVD